MFHVIRKYKNIVAFSMAIGFLWLSCGAIVNVHSCLSSGHVLISIYKNTAHHVKSSCCHERCETNTINESKCCNDYTYIIQYKNKEYTPSSTEKDNYIKNQASPIYNFNWNCNVLLIHIPYFNNAFQAWGALLKPIRILKCVWNI